MTKVKITKKLFKDAIKARKDFIDGVTYIPVRHLKDGRDLCLVFGYEQGYARGDADYQVDDYTLCAKLAVNIDDLQCDYDIDWYMPWDKDGNIYDTDMSVTKDCSSADWYNEAADIIANKLDNGELEVN